MRSRYYHKVPSEFLSGKAILIVIIVLVSSASFILGYFTGKNLSGTSPDDTPDELVVSEKLSPSPELGNEESEPEQISKTQGGGLTEEPLQVTPPERKETVDRKTVKPAIEVTNKKMERTKKMPSKTKNSKAVTKTVYYTIQVGAFRDKNEAEKLKTRLQKKGYSVSIIKGGRSKILYKVRVGRFQSKDQAKLTAIRLKKLERLNSLIVKTGG